MRLKHNVGITTAGNIVYFLGMLATEYIMILSETLRMLQTWINSSLFCVFIDEICVLKWVCWVEQSRSSIATFFSLLLIIIIIIIIISSHWRTREDTLLNTSKKFRVWSVREWCTYESGLFPWQFNFQMKVPFLMLYTIYLAFVRNLIVRFRQGRSNIVLTL